MRSLVLRSLIFGCLSLAACAPPGAAELALIARAEGLTAPPLIPLAQIAPAPDPSAEAAGAALAARAAALRDLAAGL